MKRFIVLFLIAASSSVAMAQPKIEFKEIIHDFGTVTEGEKPSYKFVFTNTGDEPIVLTSVKPSCGCTTPSWPKEPVLPGKTGEITATYNSQGRPGAFYKSITVVSNVDEKPTYIKIKGVVVKSNTVQYTAEQLENSPIITLDKKEYFFGNVEKGKPNKYSFKVTNTGKSDLKITGLSAGCHCVDYTLDKPVIKPGETAFIEVSYAAKNMGDNTDIVTIESNDIKTENPTITLKAKAVESLAAPSIMQQGSGFGF